MCGLQTHISYVVLGIQRSTGSLAPHRKWWPGIQWGDPAWETVPEVYLWSFHVYTHTHEWGPIMSVRALIDINHFLLSSSSLATYSSFHLQLSLLQIFTACLMMMEPWRTSNPKSHGVCLGLMVNGPLLILLLVLWVCSSTWDSVTYWTFDIHPSAYICAYRSCWGSLI